MKQFVAQFAQQHHSPALNREFIITNNNLKNNTPKGTPLGVKEDNTTRIWNTNLNGLSFDNMGGKMVEVVSTMKETQADIITCCETNSDTMRYDVSSTIYSACSSLNTPQLTCSSVPVKASTVFKPGGTFILSSGAITARLIDKGTDYLGRWSYHTYCGKQGIKNTIISCYQIPDQKVRKGRFTNFAQQQAYLLQQDRPCNNIRKLFYTELSAFITALQHKHHEILVLGDFNDDIIEVNSGMAQLLAKHHLHDLMRYSVGTTNIATYSRGRRRLDYALGSERFLLALLQGGYERFGDRLKTDHRPYYLDFDTKKLFGTLHIHPSSDQEWYLRGSDRPKLTQYIKVLHDKLSQQNVFQRMTDLLLSETPDHSLLETLDSLYTRLALKVEYDERRRYNNEWSEKLLTQRARVSVLKYHMAQYLTHMCHKDSIQWLNEKYGPFPPPESQQQCKSQLQEQQQELHKLIKDSVITRVQELDEKIKNLEMAAEEAEKDKANALRKILRAEQLKQLYQKIQRLRRTKQGVLHKLEVPLNEEDNPKAIEGLPDKWKVLDTTEEINTALMKRNINHFGQAELDRTPFFQEPLKSDINFTATTASVEQILEGDYTTADLDRIAAMFVQSLKKQHPLQTAEHLTTMEVQQRLKLWTEATTTSPSGLHLGHYKALVNSHLHSCKKEEDEDRIEYDTYQQVLLQFRTNLLNYAIKWRYSLQRWHTVINRMLMKDNNNWRIHRLRVIHLYEADYSMLLAIHWRNTLHQAEDHSLLNKGTFGSRPNRSAITPVFLEEMMLEVTRLTRKNLVLFDHDAQSCYDQIIASVMSLISRNFGASKNVVIVWTSTLEKAKFYLKTGKTVSSDFFQHCESHPIHGSGQGATNSPAGWLFISSKLFDVYDTEATGATFLSPDRSFQISIYMIGFVDDTKSQVNAFDTSPQPPIETMIHKMGKDAQLWNDLLWCSGGALELKKCSFYAISWFFDKGFPVMEGGTPRERMFIEGKAGAQEIKGLSSFKEHKTLGHVKTPNGGQQQQFLALEQKCNNHAAFIQGNYLTPREVYTYYSGMYLPSVTYVLPNSYFTEKELKKLECKAFNAIISKVGMTNKTHRAVICGPIGLGGRALRSLFHEQGILQIKLLLTESRRSSMAGGLLFIALQWAQFTLGTSTPLLEDTEPCLYSESKWITSIQTFLVRFGIQITYQQSYVLPLQRENDAYLMELFKQNGTYSDQELHRINHCRLFLQVLSLADIVTADGSKIAFHATFQGSSRRRKTTYIQVEQEDPPAASWNLWYEALASLCNPDGTLHRPLGDWTVNPNKIRMDWELFYSAEYDCIFHKPTMETLYHPLTPWELPYLPHDAIPIESATHVPPISVVQPPADMYPKTFDETVQSLPEWETCLMSEVEYTPGTKHTDLVDAIQSDDLILASDGSVESETGTFGWV